MGDLTFDHRGPWTEAEYFALPETNRHIELIDGELRVSPGSNRSHTEITFNAGLILKPQARAVGLRMHVAPTDVRLRPGRIVQPDVVLDGAPRVGVRTEAADVVLVCEVTSPGNATYDRVQKRRYYAEAQIPWYLLIEPDLTDYSSVTLQLLRLDGDHYVEHAVAKYGEMLISDGPFPLEINTEDLLDP